MKNQKTPFLIGGMFAALFVFSVIIYWQKAKKVNDMIIADDVAQLAEIFNAIHQECGIVDFEHQKNNINFLNVISFEGSEVGPMNLQYPEKWQGAYVKDNPTIQEKYYQVVRTKKVYYVVPGLGVRLSSGKMIGKDIVFDEDTDIDALVKTDLQFKERPLAIRIMTGSDASKMQDTFKEKITRDRLRGM